jgi:hypothetical protein
VVTPYDNVVTIMHEGASGGGKSEMLEYAHREPDGRLLLGENMITGERRHLSLPQGCALRPSPTTWPCATRVSRTAGGKLVVKDAEAAWFVRVNHIDRYGTTRTWRALRPARRAAPLFEPRRRARRHLPDLGAHRGRARQALPQPAGDPAAAVVPGRRERAGEVDVRSFGVRTPPCTASSRATASSAVAPPAAGLAWLWRLVAPRGHANPSITDTEGMTSEGVGSYWPFATGRRSIQANLLLEQIGDARGPATR